MTAARLLAMGEAGLASRREDFVRRRRLRRLVLQAVVRYPEKLSGPLTWELISGGGHDGLVPALDALIGYSFRDRLPRIEIPVLIVWGRNDILVPVDDAERLRAADRPERAQGDLRGHRPRADDRAPDRFNQLVAGFLAGERVPGADVAGVSA